MRFEGQNVTNTAARGRVCSPLPDNVTTAVRLAPRYPRARGGGGGFVVSKGHFNSRARKRASKEPGYWTSAQLSDPARKLVDAEMKIARELGLSQSLRQRLSDCVRSYIDDTQAASEAPRLMQAKVRRRLKSIKTAASKLRKSFTEHPKAAATIDELEAFEGSAKALDLDSNLLFAEMLKLLRRKSVYVDGRSVLGDIRLDFDDLCEKLDALSAFIGNQKKSKGGRPPSEAWNSLMRQLAAIYKDATGKKPTITENEHRAGVCERYSGQFMRVATLIDQATAGFCNTKARPKSALGPALRRLIEAQPKRRRNETP